MCSVETNDMVELQGSVLLEVQEENDLSKVQESHLSEVSHPALGESLRSGETNRTAEESL
jgi:hypothetical protein